jgi:hypothetical protein
MARSLLSRRRRRFTVASRVYSGTEARELVIRGWLSRLLPPADDYKYELTASGFRNWRVWATALIAFVLTATPYYALVLTIGPWVAINPLFLAYLAGRHLHPAIPIGLALVVAWRAIVRRRERRQTQSKLHDRSYLNAIAFVGGSELLSPYERLKACFAHSLVLQRRGILPLITLFTAIPGNWLFMEVYRRQVRNGSDRDAALGHIVTVRTARIGIALLALCVTALIAWAS